MQYKIIFREQRKLVTAPICGAVVGQEYRLDVTNPHTERFFKNLKNRPAVGVWYRLGWVVIKNQLMRIVFWFNCLPPPP